MGGSGKVNGVRVPSILIRRNGLLDNLSAIWKPNAKVLIICADPDDHKKNDEVCACLEKSLPMSGLSISALTSAIAETAVRWMRWKAWMS